MRERVNEIKRNKEEEDKEQDREREKKEIVINPL